jgi:signal transduction histidine kinase
MDQFTTPEQSAEVLNLTEVLRNCLTAGVLTVDGQGRIRAFDAVAERLIGSHSGILIGQSTGALPPPLKQLIDDTFATAAEISGRQLTWADESGEPFVLQASSVHCPAQDDALHSVVVVIHDLAPAHKIGLLMQRLDRLASLGTLSAGMAHEIKNALVAITTFIQQLMERNLDSELTGIVSRELRRIDGIVSHMLKFAGPAKPTLSRISLHKVLDHCLRLVQPQLKTNHIQLRRSWAAQPDMIDGDDYQIEQAFLNLLLNGITAMQPQGQLSVATESIGSDTAEPQLQVTISDTGAGIPAEHLGKLFEPFFSTKPQGTGLGLAIARRIILEHRGKINVESQVNQGTTFRVCLPLPHSTASGPVGAKVLPA